MDGAISYGSRCFLMRKEHFVNLSDGTRSQNGLTILQDDRVNRGVKIYSGIGKTV